ncbi:MAG TPA: hypothetical protein VLL28_11400, partial [Hyphomicrobiaceae bacterium]|nr:hypothetical protein [Hyphomicrobiaceae bacterium]
GGSDEAPEVYKRLPDVLAAHGDTIRVKHTLRPLGALAKWKISSVSPTVIAVRPIRFLTVSTTEVLSVTF